MRIIPVGFGEKQSWIPLLVSIVLVLQSLLSSACTGSVNISGPGDPDADLYIDELNFNGKIIEPKIRTGEQSDPTDDLLPSQEFWFSIDDDKTLRYGWTSVVLRTRDPEIVMCNHPRSSRGCRECDLCTGICNDSPDGGLPERTDKPIATLRKSYTENQSANVHEFFSPLTGCLNQPRNRSVFTDVKAENNVTYELEHVDFVNPGSTGLERKIHFKTHVVSNAVQISQTLDRYTGDRDPALRFKFQMPESNSILRENFSPRLRVTKVRVLLGTWNKSTGKEMIMDDPTSLLRVRPSRILFLPDFIEGDVNSSGTEDSNRCYVDPKANDGGFDLTKCRKGLEARTIAPFLPGVTPTFEINRYRETLTWLIEYKPSDGIPEPTFINNDLIEEYPVLEWTIE